jgi:single-strand DNA-binding protein
MNINQVIIAGRLTRDPEIRHTQGGLSVCNFGIANNKKIGEKDVACFVDVSAFGKQADAIAQYLKKGNKICVIGRLELEQWEKDGERKSKHKIVCDRFEFVDGPKDREEEAQPARKAAPAPRSKQPVDDDIPF